MKTVLITGAASGIGRATALAFAENGYKIALADIDQEAGLETQSLIGEGGNEAVFIKTDVANPTEVELSINEMISNWGSIDCAVNNAGIPGPEVKLESLSVEAWAKVIAVNLSGVFYCLKYELPQMVVQNQGSIVNVSSVAGLRGLGYGSAYSASKHGVIGLTRSAAQEYGRNNIRINAVSPVFTNTPILDNSRFLDPTVQEKIKKRIPLGRFGEAEDVAQTILWLCSDDARFLSGIVLPIDGGMTSG